MHSIIGSGLIVGGKNASQDRQTVFFAAVNPLATHYHEQKEFDLTKPDLLPTSKSGRYTRVQSVYWVDIRLAQRKGLKLY